MSKLSAVSWPGQAETDVRTLVTDLGQVNAALFADDGQAFDSAAENASTASGFVRHDLGLPRYSGNAS